MNIQNIIKEVEQFIPFNYKKNFYKNIQNLTIEYIGIKDLNCEYNEEINEGVGEYDYNNNKIIINLDAISNAVAQSKHKEESYEELLKHTLIHELLHMASTCYKRRKPIWNGFDEINSNEEYIEQKGLTEGYTELLTSAIDQKDTIFLKNHPYAFQILFAKQIEIIIGKEIMLDAYFNDSNIKLIQKKLKNINSSIAVDELLELITDILTEQQRGSIPYDEITYIQNELIKLFKTRMLKNKLTFEEVCEFERYIIDEDVFERNLVITPLTLYDGQKQKKLI